MNDIEHWEWIKGWEPLYLVSTLGRIMSVPREHETKFGARIYGGGIVRPLEKNNGYLVVNLTAADGRRSQVLVHRIVLTAFAGEQPAGMECCHYDGNRKNNEISNLRWDTRKNNHQDKKRHGTWQSGENHWRAKHAARC